MSLPGAVETHGRQAERAPAIGSELELELEWPRAKVALCGWGIEPSEPVFRHLLHFPSDSGFQRKSFPRTRGCVKIERARESHASDVEAKHASPESLLHRETAQCRQNPPIHWNQKTPQTARSSIRRNRLGTPASRGAPQRR